MNNFPEWLETKLQQKDWKPADLSRRSGIDSGFLSRLLSGERQPGLDACLGIATALNIPIAEVIRHARPRSLPPLIATQAETQTLLHHFQPLPRDDRQRVITITRALHEQQATYNAGDDDDH